MSKIQNSYGHMAWVKKTWVSGKLTYGMYYKAPLKAHPELCSFYQSDPTLASQETGPICELQASLGYISRPYLRTKSKSTTNPLQRDSHLFTCTCALSIQIPITSTGEFCNRIVVRVHFHAYLAATPHSVLFI